MPLDDQPPTRFHVNNGPHGEQLRARPGPRLVSLPEEEGRRRRAAEAPPRQPPHHLQSPRQHAAGRPRRLLPPRRLPRPLPPQQPGPEAHGRAQTALPPEGAPPQPESPAGGLRQADPGAGARGPGVLLRGHRHGQPLLRGDAAARRVFRRRAPSYAARRQETRIRATRRWRVRGGSDTDYHMDYAADRVRHADAREPDPVLRPPARVRPRHRQRRVLLLDRAARAGVLQRLPPHRPARRPVRGLPLPQILPPPPLLPLLHHARPGRAVLQAAHIPENEQAGDARAPAARARVDPQRDQAQGGRRRVRDERGGRQLPGRRVPRQRDGDPHAPDLRPHRLALPQPDRLRAVPPEGRDALRDVRDDDGLPRRRRGGRGPAAQVRVHSERPGQRRRRRAPVQRAPQGRDGRLAVVLPRGPLRGREGALRLEVEQVEGEADARLLQQPVVGRLADCRSGPHLSHGCAGLVRPSFLCLSSSLATRC
ncbi:UPF0481 protein-like [Iris pallida]|uniref:UPF0481 protein-like n=1 Tax=Iris pallida TaxID=29817 RepID=A0AAX6EK98_IRIPA|nr:UPF0481 protein-like [Iris pallida]